MHNGVKVLAGLVVLASSLSAGVGMRTQFSSARIDNLLPGEVYNTREFANLPYTIINSGQEDMIGTITINIPRKEDCRPGYDPIEEAIWVQVSDNVINLRVGAKKTVDIIIRIPDKPEYYDRKFQAGIEAVGRAKTGNVATGIVSRLYLSTVPTLEEQQRRKKKERERKKILANLNFEFLPGKTFLFDIKPGKKYDVEEASGKKLKIVNMNDEKYSYTLTSVSESTAQQPVWTGYEATPDPAWLTFEKNTYDVDENMIMVVNVFLKIPKGKEHLGKRYQFFIKVDLLGQKIPVSIYSYVMVQMKEK